MLSKYGPVEQRIHNELVSKGFRVFLVNTRDDGVGYVGGKAVLLLDDAFEAFVISGLFEDTLNPRDAYIMAINRALLFRELSRLGYPTPEVSIALNPNVVGKLIKGLGRAYLATPTPALGLDGVVTTWEGGKSVAEHRMYMANPLARINMVIRAPDRLINAQVIGDECIGCGELGNWVLKLSRDIKCLMCTYTIGAYGSDYVVLGIEPRVELIMNTVNSVVSTIVGWLDGRW
ncbi:ATP-grasp domain-containing protein [Vulcanisaeta sp. JCM 14467]